MNSMMMPMPTSEPWSAAVLLSSFSVGLLSSGHCIGMCGGITTALSASSRNTQKNQWLLALHYNLGRISVYTLLGALVGLFSLAILPHQPFWQFLRLLAGIMIILMGCYLAGWWRILTQLESLGTGLWKYIQPLTHKVTPNSYPSAYASGLLWGFLPCGMVYSALTLSASLGSSLHSASSMFMFGLGTLPSMLLSVRLSAQFQLWLTRFHIRKLAGMILIVAGSWIVYGLAVMTYPHGMRPMSIN